MQSINDLKLVDDYLVWYKNNTLIKIFEGFTQIITPFVNNLNDRVQPYLESIDNNRIRISDDSETIRELEFAGLDMETKTRQRLQEGILNHLDFGSFS